MVRQARDRARGGSKRFGSVLVWARRGKARQGEALGVDDSDRRIIQKAVHAASRELLSVDKRALEAVRQDRSDSEVASLKSRLERLESVIGN